MASSSIPAFVDDFVSILSVAVFLLPSLNSVVVNILQKDMFPQDVDTEICRGCYAICLQLARYVIDLTFFVCFLASFCRIFVYYVFAFCLFCF